MRLLSTESNRGYQKYQIHEFFGDHVPEYAILSHTWGEEEVTFQDMQHLDEQVKKRQGFQKIAYTCEQARRDGLSWAWVDTCCIDKTSSAELTEAINSMYAWYRDCAICYAYLVDVSHRDDPFAPDSAFRTSRWFTRCWTLQELIAPRTVEFYDKEWASIETKTPTQSTRYSGDEKKPQERLAKLLRDITGIPEDCLVEHHSPSMYSVARRMSWASKRNCTRVEDAAYSLMGIFDVNMPLLYGEGTKAFIRLQEEIFKEIDDHSLFAWTVPAQSNPSWVVSSLFAQSPAAFSRSGNIIPVQEEVGDISAMTKKGLRVNLNLSLTETKHPLGSHCAPDAFYAILNCAEDRDRNRRIAMILIPESSVGMVQPPTFLRCGTTENVIVDKRRPQTFQTLYVRKIVLPVLSKGLSPSSFSTHRLPLRRAHDLAFRFINLGMYGQAEALFRHILDRRWKEFGNQHISTLLSISNVALLLQALHQYEEAEVLHRRALNGMELAMGKDSLATLLVLEDLASVLQDLRRYEEAEVLHRRVLEQREEHLWEDHWDTLASLSNLGSVLCSMGRSQEGESLLQKALAGREAVLGKSHPDTLTSLNNLASVQRALGNYKNADKLCLRVLEIVKGEMGEDHPDTVASACNLALVQRDLGQVEDAEKCQKKHLDHIQDHRDDMPILHDHWRKEVTVSTFNHISPTAWISQHDREVLRARTPQFPTMESDSNGRIAGKRISVRWENTWMNEIAELVTLIRNVPDKIARPVKIAVIDHGIADALDIHDDNYAWVKSFRSRGNLAGIVNSCFSKSAGKRWALISAMISHICPKSRLYVARLDERAEENIVADRIAEAIRWAVDCNVDLICISAINNTEHDEYGELQAASDQAAECGIPILCSALDGSSRRRRDIRIKGTTPTAGPFGMYSRPGVDVVCHGEEITFADSDETAALSVSGDSAATAAASGLAGILLYCERLSDENAKDEFRMDSVQRGFRSMMLSDEESGMLKGINFSRKLVPGESTKDDLGQKGDVAKLIDSYKKLRRQY
ncbi:hypothetical protein F5Y14DRAFT_424388 [Nemania sp. NC0429]|nr:hypothetical protein F5Y14DRAFT_424388 [Nemania sp. NC0429]